MQPGHLDEKLSLVMAAASNGLDDAVLNAPLPDMGLHGDHHVQHEPPTSAELQAAGHHLIHNEDPQHTLGLIQELNSHSHTHTHQEVSVGIITGEEHVNNVNVNNIELAGDTVDTEEHIITVDPTMNNTISGAVERPAKRRRGGRRVSNPNMTPEERRRQRVLKNRESAMRSLQKKAQYSANLAVEQKEVSTEHEQKKSHMFTLVSTADELRQKLDANHEIAVSIANCIEKCNSFLQTSSLSTASIPSASVRKNNSPTNTNSTIAPTVANINGNINDDTKVSPSSNADDDNSNSHNNDPPATTEPENNDININHNLNIANVPPAVPQAAIQLVPPIILPTSSTAQPSLPPQ